MSDLAVATVAGLSAFLISLLIKNEEKPRVPQPIPIKPSFNETPLLQAARALGEGVNRMIENSSEGN